MDHSGAFSYSAYTAGFTVKLKFNCNFFFRCVCCHNSLGGCIRIVAEGSDKRRNCGFYRRYVERLTDYAG